MHERKYKPSANWLNGWQIGNCVVIVFLCLCEWNRKKEEERINAEIAAKPSGIPSIEWKIGKGKANPISTNRQRFKCENCVTTKCTKSHRHQKRSSVNKEVSNKMLKLLYLSYIYLFSVFLRANIHFLGGDYKQLARCPIIGFVIRVIFDFVHIQFLFLSHFQNINQAKTTSSQCYSGCAVSFVASMPLTTLWRCRCPRISVYYDIWFHFTYS